MGRSLLIPLDVRFCSLLLQRGLLLYNCYLAQICNMIGCLVLFRALTKFLFCLSVVSTPNVIIITLCNTTVLFKDSQNDCTYLNLRYECGCVAQPVNRNHDISHM